ncbi:MAG TPA: DUF2268 domain-containing putative Zn-dependent protease [Candidatus Nanoarchaeia archaeon]|nr:DUF2268 domain-containing putative Zn-dependent protease [Candidatus Nanoarchaeia archaeon]
MKKYEFEINNVPVEVNSYLDEANLEKEELIDSILKQTKPNRYIGYGGWIKEEYFKKSLELSLKSNEEMKNKKFRISDKEHIEEIKKALEKCSSVLEKKLYIFTFPTYSKFISEKMNGAGGSTPYKNIFYLKIPPHENKEKQKESIQHTVAHEIGHALSEEPNLYSSPSRMFKEEGLNEHFREEKIGGGRDPWTKAISKEKAMEIFNEIKEQSKLYKTDRKSHREIFFGTGKYPLWSGYTIGYYLIEDYLNSLKDKENIDWKKFFKTPSKKIIDSIIEKYSKD